MRQFLFGWGGGGGGGRRKNMSSRVRLSDFQILFGVISGNINPPGGCRGQIPGFWKPRFQQKVEFGNGLVDFFLNDFLKPGSKKMSVALTF